MISLLLERWIYPATNPGNSSVPSTPPIKCSSAFLQKPLTKGELLNLIIKEFFLGFIRIHILHHATKEPVYGLWLIEELRRHGYKLSPGTLYPILHKMQRDNHIKSYPVLVNGRIRKYYKITPTGRKSLTEAKKKARELIKEIEE